MASQARQLSNHYEMLGVSPAASQSEIGAAFGRALANFARPVLETVHIYQAFEVLRQPDRRLEYDRSIGLRPKPRQPQFKISSQGRTPFAVAAQASDAEHPIETSEPEAHGVVAPVPLSTAPAEQTEVQEVATPTSAPIAPRAEHPAEPGLDELVESILAEGRAEKAALRKAERQPQDWRRIAIAAGALVAGAGMIGGLAGVSASGSGTEEAAVDLPLPSPSPYLAGTEPSVEPVSTSEVPVASPRESAAKPARTINPLVIPPEVEAAMAARSRILPESEVTGEVEATAAADDPLAPPAAVAATPATAGTSAPVETARMPLPNATIARTIQKIGYPCGGVSSVAPVSEGGVFKVTCSSGHSYRAAPIGGRYRFKKWRGA